MEYTRYLDDYPDFPQPGVVFKDISPLLATPGVRDQLVRRLVTDADVEGCTHIAGIDARGFIFAALTAAMSGRPLIMIRKAGKLPGQLLSQHYTLEYGEELLEVNPDLLGDDDRARIVDDVLATGGTAQAAVQLIEKTGAGIHGLAFPIEIAALGGREKLRPYAVTSVVKV
jgi:adenine phosphoribosyltransferase